MPPEPGADRRIVRAAIHPSIGVARVGDSREGFRIGPETVRPVPATPDEIKDPTGALTRQAARFRVYGYDAAGEVVAELTDGTADVGWTVHLANRKAAWYQFQLALDIPEAAGAPASGLRNADVTGDDRAQLVIDPGPRTIGGPDVSGAEYRFDTGTFFGTPVYLGEVRTDAAGRLVVLGGHGRAGSRDGSQATTFANNDGWYDDTADGPVTATVTVDGRPVPVDPAWVVVAPPNYAPELAGVRTLYDLLFDVFVQAGTLPFPERVSFTRDVLPIFERLAGMGWVNQGFAGRFGPRGREHFLDPDYLHRLASGLPADRELRTLVYMTFRDRDRDGVSPVPWPWIYGDAMSLPAVSAGQHSVLSPTQMRVLELWAAGRFDADLDGGLPAPFTIDDVPLAGQPEMLDRASLTYCLADAFHPGCEVTWPIRHRSMYSAPFRIRHRADDRPEPSMGTQLTPSSVTRIDGPLYGQSPGGLTRWMAVPWHTDTASCRSGYYLGYGPRYDPYLPTFWAARVPNQVLTEAGYATVLDESLPFDERAAAFEDRAAWLRGLPEAYLGQINAMVEDFGRLGVVQTRPGPSDGAFGAEVLVETGFGLDDDAPPQRNLRTLHVPADRDPQRDGTGHIEKVDRFPGRR